MLSKLLKYDLRKDMRWLWIIFVVTIGFAGISRGCGYLSENIAFFKILKILFDSIFYSLAVNCIIQPFLRSFLNFTKSLYGDESYLTHTLPVTKNELLASKALTSIIEILLGFGTLIISLLIMYASPKLFDTLQLLISTIVIGKFSIYVFLTLVILLIIVEFLMYISIIFFSIVIAYRQKEKRVLKAFLLTAGMAFISISILSIILLVVLLINDVSLSSPTLVLSKSAFMSIVLTGIFVYLLITIFFYLLTRKELNKGVDVD